jgi:hypothetical protein
LGLKGDLDEVFREWHSSPWRVRVFLVFCFFLASGSIASLSETVAKWKSFFLDAVTFYRHVVSGPIEHLLQMLRLPFPPGMSDAFILLGLMTSANIRLLMYKGASQRARYGAIAMMLSAVLLLLTVFLTRGSDFRVSSLIGGLFAIAAYSSSMYIRIGGAARFLWFVSLLTPMVLVGVAAAVNVGLSK